MNGLEERQQAAQNAMRMLDKIVAEKPEKNGHDFSEATRCLTAFREHLLAERRAEGAPLEAHCRLGKLNAVISGVVGGHFPIGAVPWKHVEAARESFAQLLEEMALR
jgi:formate dehydrogenase major subunit